MFIDNTMVYYEKDFLSNQDFQTIDKLISDNQDVIQNLTTDGRYKTFPIDAKDFVQDLSERVKNLIINVYGPETLSVIYPRDEIQFLSENDSMGLHNDAEGQNVAHGVVLYISDPKTYDGGEIYYPKLGLSLRPDRGSIVIHPRENDYTHGVKVVSRGYRFVMVMFTAL